MRLYCCLCGILDDEKRYRYSVSQEKKKVDKNVQKGVKHRMKKRILSFILSLVMVIGIVPTSVFADGEVDTESGPASGGYGSTADGSWTGSEKAAMRMSLYFTDFTTKNGEKIKINSKDEFLAKEDIFEYTQIGKTIDFYKDLVPSEVTFYSGMSVYRRMHEGFMDSAELKDSGYTDMTQNMYSVASDFPVIFDSNGTSDKYVKYFMGSKYVEEAKTNQKEAWAHADIVNDGKLQLFLDKIIEGDNRIQSIDFKEGSYIDANGATIRGAFKFYFEPVVEIMIGGKWFAVTLRDMIAMQNSMNLTFDFTTKDGKKMTNQPLNSAFATLSRNLGNATRLTHDQPLVSMFAYNGSNITSYSYDESDDLYRSGGLGVITGMVETPFAPEVKVVTSYIKITGYNEKGEAIYVETEKAEDTKVEMVKPDNDGNISIKPMNEKNGKTYLLNDVFVTQKDIIPNLRNSDSVEVVWTDKMPENRFTNEKVEKSFKEVDGFIENIVLGDAKFQDELSEQEINPVISVIYRLSKVSPTLRDHFNEMYKNLYKKIGGKDIKYITDYDILIDGIDKELLDKMTISVYDLDAIPVTADGKRNAVAIEYGPDNVIDWEIIKEANKNIDDLDFVIRYKNKLINFGVDVSSINLQAPKTNASVSSKEVSVGKDENLESVVYLRYIVTPTPHEVHILKRTTGTTSNSEIVLDGLLTLDADKGILTDIRNMYPTARPVEFYTADTYTTDLNKLPDKNGHKDGKGEAVKDPIPNYNLDDTVYVFWEINDDTPRQVNILIDENSGDKSHIGTNPLVPEGNKTQLKDKREDFPDIVPVEYHTNPKFTEDPDDVPSSDGIKTGEGEEVKDPIIDLPQNETVYVIWKRDPSSQKDSGYVVPQWRLSKYWPHLINSDGSNLSGSTNMHFSTGTSGCCCGGGATLSGSWSYTMVNPNGTLTRWTPNLIDQMKVKSYLHSKALDEGSTKSPSLFSPSGRVTLSGNLNAIKSTDKSGLKLATWLNPSLTEYDIEGSTNPLNKSEGVYKTFDILPYRFKNTNSFFNMWFICSCEDGTDDDGDDYHITRYTTCTNTIGPDDPSYSTQDFGLGITFKRYNQQAKDKLKVDPVVSVENGLTTLKYQLTDTLNIYPEYGMLFQADDGNTQDLKWVVGDENRQISPVVYQTLQHKVYVSPVTSGTSVATDSRAITNAAKLGEGNKQVIYKGSAMGNAFAIYQDSNMKSAGLLTAKTFALDIKDSVKSAWGDGSYNSYAQHQTLLDSLNGEKAAYDEHLLIDSPNYGSVDYTGGSIKGFSPEGYKLRQYNGEDKVTLEHELIVRGGKLVAVRVAEANKTTKTLKTIEKLKAENNGSKTSLYAALVNMNLIDESGNKENTVFKAFEHLTGDVLTEGTYATLLKNARNTVDGQNVSSSVEVKEGQGWYSEDTTVLVVKEYISNFTVPGVSVSDKIALSVNGLVTPQNKAQFFSQMGKGYLHLNYDITCNKAIYEGLPEIHSWFTYTSYPSDEYAFGKQETQYLVPNVSITDTTRLN